jgi:Ser-tRNA(Ala) deacylase AlaX
LKQAIETLDTVRFVDPTLSKLADRVERRGDHNRFQSESSHRNPPSVEESIRLDCLDGIQPCSCVLKNTSDVQEVESFLKSKIESGSTYYPWGSSAFGILS